jgi:2-polyprenyl-3-methyl-5-hydroxy-6-metoxy-1,4-benzoquinol methylase
MELEEKEKTIRRYEERLQKYGASVKALGWRDIEQQYVRFAVLAEVGNLNNCSVLDIGCGFGDFYDFLETKGINTQYTGYDISTKFIKIAQKRHPALSFAVKDILEEKTSKKFDYVVSSGVVNARLSDNEGVLQRLIAECFKLCKIGAAVNMMSKYVDYEDKSLFYYSPERVFTFCKTLTKRVTLRHDYMPFEFTVYLYKDQRINDSHVFVQAAETAVRKSGGKRSG